MTIIDPVTATAIVPLRTPLLPAAPPTHGGVETIGASAVAAARRTFGATIAIIADIALAGAMMTMIAAGGEGIGRRPAAAVPTHPLHPNETLHAAVTMIAAVRIAKGIERGKKVAARATMIGTVRIINVLERAGVERAHGGLAEMTREEMTVTTGVMTGVGGTRPVRRGRGVIEGDCLLRRIVTCHQYLVTVINSSNSIMIGNGRKIWIGRVERSGISVPLVPAASARTTRSTLLSLPTGTCAM